MLKMLRNTGMNTPDAMPSFPSFRSGATANAKSPFGDGEEGIVSTVKGPCLRAS